MRPFPFRVFILVSRLWLTRRLVLRVNSPSPKLRLPAAGNLDLLLASTRLAAGFTAWRRASVSLALLALETPRTRGPREAAGHNSSSSALARRLNGSAESTGRRCYDVIQGCGVIRILAHRGAVVFAYFAVGARK